MMQQQHTHVAYRVMEYDREPLTEEQFEVVLEMLFGFYNEREIERSISKISYLVPMMPS